MPNLLTRLRTRWQRWHDNRQVDKLLHSACRCVIGQAQVLTFNRTGRELDEAGVDELRLAFLRSLMALGPQWLDVFLEHPTRYINLFLSDYF